MFSKAVSRNNVCLGGEEKHIFNNRIGVNWEYLKKNSFYKILDVRQRHF